MRARINLAIPSANFYFSALGDMEINGKKLQISFVNAFNDKPLYTSIAISATKLFVMNKPLIGEDDEYYSDWIPITNGDERNYSGYINFGKLVIVITPSKIKLEQSENGFFAKIKCFIVYDDKKSLQTYLEIDSFLVEK